MMVVSLPHIYLGTANVQAHGASLGIFRWQSTLFVLQVDTKVCKTGNYAILDAQVTGISACHLVEVK